MKSVVLLTSFLLITLSLFSVIHKIGEVLTPGNAKCISVSGNLAFVAAETSGLQVIDIKDLHNPKMISSYQTEGYVNAVASIGNKVYLADSNLGMAVLDVSNPLKPLLLGSVKTPDFPYAITISGNKAYLAVRFAGMQIVDITDPGKPLLLGSCVIPNGLKPEDLGDEYDTDDISALLGTAQSIAVQGNYAYVGANNAGFHIIDISNAQHPKLIHSDFSLKNVGSIELSGAIAYVGDYDEGLKIYDVSLPSKPLLLGSYKSPSTLLSLYIIGDLVYLSEEADKFEVIDVSNPKQPVRKAFYNMTDPGLKFTIVKDLAFLACGEKGIDIFDMSDLANPPYLSAIRTTDFAYSVNVMGNTAYVVNSSKLQIMDVTDSNKPLLLGSLKFPLNSRGGSLNANYITIQGKTAYITTMEDGVKIVDISNPQKPQLTGGFRLPAKNTSNVSSLSVVGSVAYVTDFFNRYLYTFDVADPLKAKQLGSCLLPGFAYSATVKDNLAYVADEGSGLQIVDVSQPKSLKLLSSYPIQGDAHFVTIKDNYAYVTDWRCGLVIIDVSKPSAPSLAATIKPHPTSKIEDSAIEGNHLIMYDINWNEFSIYDISNPKKPVLVSTYPWNLTSIGFTQSMGKIYTADGDDGMYILDYQVMFNK